MGENDEREPPPPGFADLGDGRLLSLDRASADDCRAAAAWLAKHYPQHAQDPATGRHGPIYNMGYELTREARGGMPRGWSMGQRALVLILADICNDRTRRPPARMDVSPQLLEELGITPGGLRNILTSLAADGFEFRVAAGKDKRGLPVFAHRGHAVDYQFPEIPPRASEGALNDAPLPVDNPSETATEGASVSAPSDSKAHPSMDLSSGKAHPSMLKGASVDAPLTTMTPSSKDDARRVGDPIADKLGQDQRQDQDQEPSVRNSQNRRVPDGPETVADEAQEISSNDAESVTAGSCARETVRRAGRWKSQQEMAAEQADASRAQREAAGRAAS